MEKAKSSKKSKNNTNKKIGNTNYLRIIEITILIIAIIISCSSAYFAYQANEHTQIIKEATLQIGHVKFTNNTLIICLINGYYSRYPALITSATACTSNYCTNLNIETEEGEWLLIKRDKPGILTMPFDNAIMKNISDGSQNISVEIRYVDFGEMVLKSTNATYEIYISNHNITHVNLIDVKAKELREIEI